MDLEDLGCPTRLAVARASPSFPGDHRAEAWRELVVQQGCHCLVLRVCLLLSIPIPAGTHPYIPQLWLVSTAQTLSMKVVHVLVTMDMSAAYRYITPSVLLTLTHTILLSVCWRLFWTSSTLLSPSAGSPTTLSGSLHKVSLNKV